MPQLESMSFLQESDLMTEIGLPAREIHGRLVALSRAQHRVESALAFYLLEVERRALFVELGHASTVDYARECLGLEDRKTRTLLGLACRLERLPKMKEAFRLGELPYTKAREVVRVATPENDEAWVEKCKTLTNRQIEQEVRRELPPERSRMLFFALDESRIGVWGRVREGMERLAGKTLTDIEVWDLICAEALCTYDTTPPLGDESQPMGGYVREIIERDGFQCTRPGCSNRSCLTGNHIEPRSLGGTEALSNLHTVCIVCHHAIETGRLKVCGRAPDEITWQGPFGVIEKPLSRETTALTWLESEDTRGSSQVNEPRADYASPLPSHVGRISSHVGRRRGRGRQRYGVSAFCSTRSPAPRLSKEPGPPRPDGPENPCVIAAPAVASRPTHSRNAPGIRSMVKWPTPRKLRAVRTPNGQDRPACRRKDGRTIGADCQL